MRTKKSSTSKTKRVKVKPGAKKLKAKRTRSQSSSLARAKGATFERKIATELRAIYDPPSLIKKLELAILDKDLKTHRALLKQSSVSRGEQTRGAKHPDLLIPSCPCWLELQHAAGGYNPRVKLEQAERDVEAAKSTQYPVSVCLRSGHRSIEVCMRFKSLLELSWGPYKPVEDDTVADDMIVIIDWEDFKALLLSWRPA